MPYGPENRRVRHRGYGDFADSNAVIVSGAWNLAMAEFQAVQISTALDNNLTDLVFKPDGTKMYVIGQTNDRVYEYDLGIAWNLSSAVFLQFFSVAAQDLTPTGVTFKPDGTKMYVTGDTNDRVYEYDLGTAWDISTAVFLQFFSVSVMTNTPSDLTFKPDGTKMYVIGSFGTDRVNEVTL
jgi:DNA-binding beta-propeller fold protein YncE